MFRAGLNRWFQSPVASGRLALLYGMAALGIPTLVRAAVSGVVTGCEFTPYLPFVLISAVVLRWWQASIVALAAVAIMGGMLCGSPSIELPCFIPATGIFLASSAMMIGIAVLVRRVVATIQGRGINRIEGGIVFSLEKGDVWASWYGQGAPIRLGSQRKVSEMMRDFLAQLELGKRLKRK